MSVVEAAFVGVVLAMMLSLLFIGWKTPEVVVFLALVLVWNAGIVSTQDALSGFNNPGVLAVGSLFVVIKGVERSRLADRAAKRVFGLRTSFSAGLLRLMGFAFLLSAFLNNTPVVALLIPITKDWALTRGFSPSFLLMPLSYACIFGGLVTIIGTSTNLVVQGLVLEAGEEDPSIRGLGFFEPGYIGLPLGLVGMLYLVVAAPRVLPRGAGDGGSALDCCARERAGELLTEVQVMPNFAYIGQAVALVLARLGLPAETLVKIRRTPPVGAPDTPVPLQETFRTEGLGDTHCEGAPVASDHGERTPPHNNAIHNSGKPGGRKGLVLGWDSKASGPPLSAAASPASPASAATAAAAAAIARGSSVSPSITHLGDANRSPGYTAETFSILSTPEKQRARRTPQSFDTSPGLSLREPVDTGRGHDGQQRRSRSSHFSDVCPVSPSESVRDGDTLVLSCIRPTMMSFQGSVVSEGLEGLEILGANIPQVMAHGNSFLELVLSERNRFVGRRPSGSEGASLASLYGCRIVAVRHATIATTATAATTTTTTTSISFSRTAPRRSPDEFPADVGDARTNRHKASSIYSAAVERGEEEEEEKEDDEDEAAAADKPLFLQGEKGSPGLSCATQDPAGSSAPEYTWGMGVEVAQRPLAAGDIVLVLANEGFAKKWKDSREFDLVTRVGSVPEPVRTYDYLSLLVFCGMLVWVLFFGVVMARAAFLAGGVLIVGGWVDPRKSIGYVDWALLLLVGSALGLSKAISNSGLAGYAGNAIKESGMSASVSLYVLYGFTMMCTELITNNAAAALAVPIALSIAKELEVSYKPFVLTVMMAASSSFITPIGYQTNTMVWAPGGYRFSDFIKLGTPLSLIYLVVGGFLMPRVFPF